ncbi:hypothetical protein G7046_g7431 [Stylonectria norvegica]|nr:hypothetical protein G7046_g7431 [Stylonectria norvegica]
MQQGIAEISILSTESPSPLGSTITKPIDVSTEQIKFHAALPTRDPIDCRVSGRWVPSNLSSAAIVARSEMHQLREHLRELLSYVFHQIPALASRPSSFRSFTGTPDSRIEQFRVRSSDRPLSIEKLGHFVQYQDTYITSGLRSLLPEAVPDALTHRQSLSYPELQASNNPGHIHCLQSHRTSISEPLPRPRFPEFHNCL